MSFLNSMKKALGFSNDLDEEDILELTDESPSGCSELPAEPQPAQPQSRPVSGPVSDDTLPGDIFDAVVQLFNSVQPEFVASCLDTEKQKQFIYNNIDKAIRTRLETLTEQAKERALLDSSESQRKMSADIAHLRELNASLEAKKNEFQSAQLSASRQKRALNERVHDLETQVANLEAEKEQFQLENRSLVNKLRVASVASSADSNSELAQENVTLKDQLQALQQELETIKNQSPVNDAEAESALQALEEKVEQFEDVRQRLDSRIADLKSQLEEATERYDALNNELELEKADNDSLRKTIETNLYAQAQSEAELKAKIEELNTKLEQNANISADTRPVEYQPKQHSRRKSKKRPVISAIDDLMENTDWFVAQEPTPIKKSDSEDDFGYKEPAKKANSQDDDKQLSLF